MVALNKPRWYQLIPCNRGWEICCFEIPYLCMQIFPNHLSSFLCVLAAVASCQQRRIKTKQGLFSPPETLASWITCFFLLTFRYKSQRVCRHRIEYDVGKKNRVYQTGEIRPRVLIFFSHFASETPCLKASGHCSPSPRLRLRFSVYAS